MTRDYYYVLSIMIHSLAGEGFFQKSRSRKKRNATLTKVTKGMTSVRRTERSVQIFWLRFLRLLYEVVSKAKLLHKNEMSISLSVCHACHQKNL